MKNNSVKAGSKSFLDEYFWKSPTRMVIYNPKNGAICDANKAYLSFHGYKREQIIGKTAVDLGQINNEVLLKVLKHIKEKGRIDNLLVKFRGKNTTTKYVLVCALPIVVDNKILFLSFATDVSQSVMTAKHIKDDLLRIYDSCDHEGVILISDYNTQKASIVYANKTAKTLLIKYPLNKMLRELKDNATVLLQIDSKHYRIKRVGNNHHSGMQLIVIYSWPESMNIRQTMKKYNLSPRRQEIVLLIIKGDSNRNIAEKLGISEHTVKDHIKDIFREMNIHNRSEIFPTLYNLR